MIYKYKIIKVDIGETPEERKEASETLSKGGELGWRIIHVGHDVLNSKIVWMEKITDDKKGMPEVLKDSTGAGDSSPPKTTDGGEGNQGG